MKMSVRWFGDVDLIAPLLLQLCFNAAFTSTYLFASTHFGLAPILR
jgi:hypothetical protein